MAYFDALNVSGDTFLLMTRNAKVLIDGGQSTARLVKALDGVDTLDAERVDGLVAGAITTRSGLPDQAGSRSRLLTNLPLLNLDQYPRGGVWICYARQTMARPTSETPSSRAMVSTGSLETRLYRSYRVKT